MGIYIIIRSTQRFVKPIYLAVSRYRYNLSFVFQLNNMFLAFSRVMTRCSIFSRFSVEPFFHLLLHRLIGDVLLAVAVEPVSNLSLIDWIDKANWPP